MLDLVKDYIADVWEGRLGFMTKISQNSSGELGDAGGGSRFRCLHGKVDTTISCMCTVLQAKTVESEGFCSCSFVLCPGPY